MTTGQLCTTHARLDGIRGGPERDHSPSSSSCPSFSSCGRGRHRASSSSSWGQSLRGSLWHAQKQSGSVEPLCGLNDGCVRGCVSVCGCVWMCVGDNVYGRGCACMRCAR